MKHVWCELLNVVLIVIGVLSATIGLHGFLFASNCIDGGVTGISTLLAKVTGMGLDTVDEQLDESKRDVPDGARARCWRRFVGRSRARACRNGPPCRGADTARA